MNPPGTAAVIRIAVLFALEREAAPFRRAALDLPNVSIHVSGIGRRRAREAAERLLRDSRPSLVIAAGFCGALSPALRVGDVVAARRTVLLTSPSGGKVRDNLPRILTVDQLVADPAEKRRLAALYKADAVDMESAAVAEVCAEYGVPFLAVRVVSDDVETALSRELVRLLSGGNVSVWKAACALVRRPALLGEFRRLARDTKLAARKLAEELVRIISGRVVSAP